MMTFMTLCAITIPNCNIHEPDSLLHAKWRALRRMATQGHDHEAESLSFKGEIMARRGTLDNATNLRFWAGQLYEIFSDFGRSMSPTADLVAVEHLRLRRGLFQSKPGSDLDSDFPARPVRLRLRRCANRGLGAVRSQRLSLCRHRFVRKARADPSLPVWHTSPPTRPGNKCLPSSLSPNIPDSVAFLGVLQFLFSAVLLFLLLLAIRHWFRIR